MRRTLVTGGARGIGSAIVAELVSRDQSAHVLLGARNIQQGEATKEAIVKKEGGDTASRITVVCLDVSTDESVVAAANAIGGPLFGVINNAGINMGSMEEILNVNLDGTKRVCEAFIPLLEEKGRVVNITSASGPTYLETCSPENQALLTSADVTWEQIQKYRNSCSEIENGSGDKFAQYAAQGLGGENLRNFKYGLSKALANALTIALARENPNLVINACTPGFIETDMTRPYLTEGQTPESLGMKSVVEGTRAPLALLLDPIQVSGAFFGSDAQRSPMNKYRSPGTPAATANRV